jgi:23S rRNA pseudouridine1911/1915/1917 synthase
MEIPIIYEDEQLLVINKPAGIVVNNAESHKYNLTIQKWVGEKYPEIFNQTSDDANSFYGRNGIVHRIDKETSGILIIAKTPESFGKLQSQFKEREIGKKYLAWVYGKFITDVVDKNITVDAPIARNPKRREKFAVVEDGKPATTIFRLKKTIVTKEGETLSLIECEPHTGRTHQIRVHLTALGNAVVGDKLYSGKKHIRRDKEIYERQYLHASSIEFEHPTTGETLKLKAPLPKDMEDLSV